MILLLGASGYIGSAFRLELEQRGLKYYVAPRADYLHPEKLNEMLGFNGGLRFDLVINCAAFITRPSVDQCEDHKAECVQGNLLFPVNLAYMCYMHHVPLLHISTGCLYNGDNGGGGWTEKDEAQLSFGTGAGYYVSSKQLSEQIIATMDKTYCCRIRLPFDEIDDPRNYVSKLTRFLKIFEARNSLSHRSDFVRACLDLWQIGAPYGVYNMTNPGSIKTSEIAELLNQQVMVGTKFNYWDEQEFLTKVARTPKSNCVLCVDKLLSTGVKMRSTREAVEHAIKNWVWHR